MPNSYVMRVNYSFTKLNGKPFFGTYQAFFKYQSNTVDGTFQLGQLSGSIYFAPAFYPPAPANIGQIVAAQAKHLVVAGGKVVEFNADADYGPLSINFNQVRFNFGNSPGPLGGEGSVKCEDPVQV